MRLFSRASGAFALTLSALTMATAPASQTRTFHLDASPARLMPLFTAAGERAWAQGWDPQILSGDSERGSVFQTNAHGHDTTWIVIDYRPQQGVASYARIVRDLNMGIVDVVCRPAIRGSDVSVTYTLTPLSGDGQRAVAAMLDPAHFDAMIEEWRSAIGAALAADPSGR
ncbi:MAG: hypothetical protein ABI846_12540 [Rudaea sp.]